MAKKLNYYQAHWSLYLAHFNFTLAHHPGYSIRKPDTLSWRPDQTMVQGLLTMRILLSSIWRCLLSGSQKMSNQRGQKETCSSISAKTTAVETRKNPQPRQLVNSNSSQAKQYTSQSGQMLMVYSTSEARYMSPRTQIFVNILFCYTITQRLQNTPASEKLQNLYSRTTGGLRCLYHKQPLTDL